MKISNYFILSILISVLLVGVSLQYPESNDVKDTVEENNINSDAIPESQGTKAWTFMVYLDADNNLEGAGIDDINEMEVAGSDANINIIVQIDRSPSFDSSNGDWTDTRRYFVTRDTDAGTISSTVVQNLGEVNMGLQSSLVSFIQWGKTNYPATRYALVLWDHGSGVLSERNIGGVCWDDTDGEDYLTISEVSSTLASNRVNLLCFDACLMGATEVHYQMRNYVDAVVGSEATEPGAGYPYNTILNWLKSNPTSNAEQLAEQIVIKYNNYYSSGSESVTQAAAKTLTDEFAYSLELFTIDLALSIPTQYANIKAARVASKEFDFPYYIDLYDFADHIKDLCSGDVVDSAQYLLDNITDIVIEEAHASDQDGAHGLSIYFPRSYTIYATDYLVSSFANDFLWDEFLDWFLTNSSTPGEYDDEFEENDYPGEAAIISQGEYYNLICNGSDDGGNGDLYNLSLAVGNTIQVVILFSNGMGNLDLGLYNTSSDLVNSSVSSTNGYELLSYTANANGYYMIQVVQNSPYQLYETYIMGIYVDIDDAFEENDDLVSASEIVNNTLYTNLVCVDLDCYKFWAIEGWIINVTIEFSFVEGDLDLYLYDDASRELDASETATNYENILYAANYSGYYFIVVYNYEDNLNYLLIANVSGIDDNWESNNDVSHASDLLAGYGTYINLVCFNWDIYNITISTPVWLNVTIYFSNDEGDLDLYLFNPDLDLVGMSISTNDYEVIYYNVSVAGEYCILVDNYENNLNYILAVNPTTKVWDDKYEENDDLDSPYLLSMGQSYTNLTAIDWDVYSINVQGDFVITITLDFNGSEGDLDLYLLGTSENILGTSGGIGDQEQIVYTTSATATLLILVFNYENNMHYNLTITQVEAPPSSDDDDDDDSGSKDKGNKLGIDGAQIFALIAVSSVTISYIIKKRILIKK